MAPDLFPIIVNGRIYQVPSHVKQNVHELLKPWSSTVTPDPTPTASSPEGAPGPSKFADGGAERHKDPTAGPPIQPGGAKVVGVLNTIERNEGTGEEPEYNAEPNEADLHKDQPKTESAGDEGTGVLDDDTPTGPLPNDDNGNPPAA